MVYKKNIVVALKVQGKILREEGNFVTLPFGSEYSILIKNLNSRKALVSIEIDGQDVLDGSQLIIDANSDIELEGFKKRNKVTNRFKFIEKTQEISDYRGDRIDDGIIRVEATFEKEWKHLIDNTSFWYYYPIYGSDGKNDPQWNYNVSFTNNSGFASGGIVSNQANCVTRGEFTIPNEEGITVKGNNDSKQQFVNGYIGSLESESHVIVLKLRGTYKKEKVNTPVFVRQKKKCEICGKVSKSNVKFCANCGNCLIGE